MNREKKKKIKFKKKIYIKFLSSISLPKQTQKKNISFSMNEEEIQKKIEKKNPEYYECNNQ